MNRKTLFISFPPPPSCLDNFFPLKLFMEQVQYTCLYWNNFWICQCGSSSDSAFPNRHLEEWTAVPRKTIVICVHLSPTRASTPFGFICFIWTCQYICGGRKKEKKAVCLRVYLHISSNNPAATVHNTTRWNSELLIGSFIFLHLPLSSYERDNWEEVKSDHSIAPGNKNKLHYIYLTKLLQKTFFTACFVHSIHRWFYIRMMHPKCLCQCVLKLEQLRKKAQHKTVAIFASALINKS